MSGDNIQASYNNSYKSYKNKNSVTIANGISFWF